MSLPLYTRTQDSGEPWIGALPAHWSADRLKRRAKLVTGKAATAENPIALENIEGWSGRLIETESEFQAEGVAFKTGDVLFGKLRPYLAKAYVAQRAGEAVGDFHVLRPSAGTVSEFLGYQLLTREVISQLDGSTYGSKMPRVGWDFMGSLRLPLPPPSEQNAIAAFLDRETAKIDALIEEQQRLIALLDEKRQTVISQAVTKGLDPHVPMKDSGCEWLGEVPAHWEVKRLKHITSIYCDGPFGSGLKSEHYVDQGVRVIRLQNIRAGSFHDADAAFIDPDYFHRSLTHHEVRAGDVLIAGLGDERNRVGRACVAPANIEPALVKADCFRFRLLPTCVPEFAAAQLSAGAPFSAGTLSSGSTRSRIPASTMAERPFASPPLDEQQAIVRFIRGQTRDVGQLTSAAKRAVSLLSERRSALISSAVTGKIDVRGLVEQAEAA